MTVIRSQSDIVQNMIELLRVLQPDLDTKPGTVARDLFIELPSSQLSLLYDELANVSNLQSLRFVNGTDLDNLLANYGLSRKSPTKATGLVLLTFSSLPAVVAVNKGDLVTASSGASFTVANGLSVDPANSNLYRSIATKFKTDLDFLGITDPFAVEITVQATTASSTGNIAKYSIVKTTIASVSNITNVFPFSGGADQESDPAYRTRGLAIFSGSNTGTLLGYKNAALVDPNVADALVVGPGDPLMTRDGTIVSQNSDGSFTIISEGSGGKVDVIILGKNLIQFTDGFIYRDKSNQNDPTNTKNLFVLGQITGDENKTVNRRRIDDIKNGTLPAQPVEEILEVNGSLSGSNFVPKSIDFLGRISGNYELIKDTGVFSGSPFGFDKFHWISNKISLFQEDRIKSKFNGQDTMTFTDVLQIPKIQQSVSIANENSSVFANDRSIIQLLHTPATNVIRVFNVNTGERYTVIDQNVDDTGSTNTTGRIRISGNTLPTTSDVLQVDYTWVVSFDPFVDFDGKIIKTNPRISTDSIDWGLANAVRDELAVFTKSTDGAFYSGKTKHPVSVILSAQTFKQANGSVQVVSSGNFTGRLSITLLALLDPIDTIENIILQNSSLEVFNTVNADSVITNSRVVVGPNIRYNCTIILPSDTPTQANENVVVFYNSTDIFTVGNSAGNFSGNQITIPSSNTALVSSTILLRVNYLSNVQDALTVSMPNLPTSRLGNSYINNINTGFTNTSLSNIIRHQSFIVQKDNLNRLFISLNLSSTDYILDTTKVSKVISINNAKEFWNSDNPGTIDVDVNGQYILILSGINSPQVGNTVIALFTVDDIKRSQPFTFNNGLIEQTIQPLQFNSITNKFFVDVHQFTSGSVSYSIIDPTSNAVIGTDTGTLTDNGATATLHGVAIIFDNVDELLFRKVRISNSSTNNNGLYDITSVNTVSNNITISNILDNINTNQISIIRLLDNTELWNNTGTLDITNNQFILPDNTNISVNDNVVISIFNVDNLRQAPARLSITVADQINNTGIINVSGTTITKVADVIITVINNGLKQNTVEAVKKFLSLASFSLIPGTLSLARVVQAERVITTSNDEILSTDITYDILGTSIKDNLFYTNEMIDDNTLSNTEFTLPPTSHNLANLPKIGDKLKITFYYSLPADQESLAFTRNGTLYTNKIFGLIDKIFISSGFTSTSARFILSYFNQPATGSRYQIFYDYLAPKISERISIKYTYNQLITDTTFNIEAARPISADVLVKAAQALLIDITMNIVVKTTFQDSASIVLQNVKDRLTTSINTNKLGDIIDGSDLTTVAQGVDGVDRARILFFNQTGKVGQVLSIIAQNNQFFEANNVVVNQESR